MRAQLRELGRLERGTNINTALQKMPMRLTISSLLRCETIEECRKIQRGYLPLRRLGKWSVLFTVAITILINDAIAFSVDRITNQYEYAREQFNSLTSSVLYRWTVGWWTPEMRMPELDERAIVLYTFLNGLQFTLFLAWCAYCLRWVYADCRVQDGKLTFTKFCVVALITNLLLYFFLRTWVVAYFG